MEHIGVAGMLAAVTVATPPFTVRVKLRRVLVFMLKVIYSYISKLKLLKDAASFEKKTNSIFEQMHGLLHIFTNSKLFFNALVKEKDWNQQN